ncbi:MULTISPECIES: sigma 54-interacting transcriptional regulator [unclassified Pseudomonas]|uniref:sigma 54-interacting transcriptional regulator n=1 Tax=unclassified Pseudomonas TaxID=196821 RepID=UPI00244887F1|nr:MULTISPECIES: sigma 54-interacting transcriptional regulator [unclassified Pseudomonas]MDG9930419.1 sigma 54-interacting transcriptional regulator [Pseudomonas sp. GD04042]MDH0483031.1 sigma 54-interacting transcriptional regulator [Pseudomonas sp. GD04015]MDH0605431.1 sigma 54-interacting transcriptional regulator [Pseudomonas sp. GD03869]
MEFANAELNRVRVCLIGNSKLSQLVHSLIPEFEAHASITIIDNIFNDAVRAARDLIERQAVDVCISAGANAFYLQDTLPIPVLALKVEQTDLIQAVLTARRISSKILLLTYERQETNVELLSLFEGIELSHRTYSTAEHAKEIFHNLRNQGFGVVIGSSYACDLAEHWGLESVLLYSRESCRNLIRKAIRHAGEHKRERQQRALGQFLLEQSANPQVLTNRDGGIVAWNAGASVLIPSIGRRRRLDGLLDAKVLESDNLSAEGLLVGERLCSLSKQPFEVDSERVGYLYHFVPSPVALDQGDERRLVFQSSRMAEVQNQLLVYGATPGTVLLRGETGTGKELAARQVHQASANADGPFVAINCAAIPAELFESELFGYAEGAFTSAKSGGRSGLLESANNGTFFMDEINSLPLPQQAKLLRVLQEREVTPVGSKRSISLNIKFVAACNVDLMEEVRAGRFREDLYYRLSTFAVHIPPLRERPEDIPVLASYLMRRESQRYGIEVDPEMLTKGVAPLFRGYHWPGNVRQLENLIERLIVSRKLYGSVEALLEALPRVMPELFAPLGESEEGGHLHQIEQEEIVKAMQLFGGNKSSAAEYLGISQTTLWRRLKRLKGV